LQLQWGFEGGLYEQYDEWLWTHELIIPMIKLGQLLGLDADTGKISSWTTKLLHKVCDKLISSWTVVKASVPCHSPNAKLSARA
jgi:hypothetical protein